MARTPVEELLHKVNNLLGTIQMQVDVANAVGTHAACKEALRLIADSAARTHELVQRVRAERDLTDRAAP